MSCYKKIESSCYSDAYVEYEMVDCNQDNEEGYPQP